MNVLNSSFCNVKLCYFSIHVTVIIYSLLAMRGMLYDGTWEPLYIIHNVLNWCKEVGSFTTLLSVEFVVFFCYGRRRLVCILYYSWSVTSSRYCWKHKIWTNPWAYCYNTTNITLLHNIVINSAISFVNTILSLLQTMLSPSSFPRQMLTVAPRDVAAPGAAQNTEWQNMLII